MTLVSEDFKHISAHKLVLSACSEYFGNILKETFKQSHPLICLDGVNADDLKNVLDYVYDGEVNIHQEDIGRFLKVAQKLKLEGLMSNKYDNQCLDNKWKPKMEEEEVNETEVSSKGSVPKASKKRVKSQSKTPTADIQDGEAMADEEHQQRLNENIIMQADKSVACKICGKEFRTQNPSNAKGNAKRHVEIHFEGLSYSCSHCDKTFRSKNSLQSHGYLSHK